ncbi:MAG TPA: NADH-quinone oxidoreductase subunit H [Spirochaetota bacterium]|nr:NADH-quinone oxidoreductase subunit H [Spirochaetota bacterium]HPF06657.1 NADH-quinone oxidoreductase subunit H [Spirochaetota bacterium]HPJ41353.1 NADH-quinone oxidoreductase subunit H [Spirochaetota bacterium]HRX47562.1 NADH-quinone oxidoreductase subunit H [Spirochaetota bacterium]
MKSSDILYLIIQVIAIILISPLLDGIKRIMLAKFQSRRGPADVFQTYRDIIKLFKRSETMPECGTWVFRTAPYLMFAIMATVIAVLPIMHSGSALSAAADLFLIVYLFALMRFIFGVASVDSGNPFAGIGGSREQMVALFVEPTIILSSVVVVFLAGGLTNLVEIKNFVSSPQILKVLPVFIFSGVAFLFATYVETGKKPFDVAEAEQEIQEGLLAEYAGKRLALAHGALILKQIAIVGLFITIYIPWPVVGNPFVSLVLFLIKLLVFYYFASFVEGVSTRLRIGDTRLAASGAFALAFISLILFVIGRV